MAPEHSVPADDEPGKYPDGVTLGDQSTYPVRTGYTLPIPEHLRLPEAFHLRFNYDPVDRRFSTSWMPTDTQLKGITWAEWNQAVGEWWQANRAEIIAKCPPFPMQ